MLCAKSGALSKQIFTSVFRSRSRSKLRFSRWCKSHYFLPGAREKLLGSAKLQINPVLQSRHILAAPALSHFIFTAPILAPSEQNLLQK